MKLVNFVWVVVLTHFFFDVHPDFWGEMIQFDEYFFILGWNHELVVNFEKFEAIFGFSFWGGNMVNLEVVWMLEDVYICTFYTRFFTYPTHIHIHADWN